MLEVFKQAARPFTIYASTITVCVGVLLGKPAEALMIAAGLGGANAAMRSYDKQFGKTPQPPETSAS